MLHAAKIGGLHGDKARLLDCNIMTGPNKILNDLMMLYLQYLQPEGGATLLDSIVYVSCLSSSQHSYVLIPRLIGVYKPLTHIIYHSIPKPQLLLVQAGRLGYAVVMVSL